MAPTDGDRPTSESDDDQVPVTPPGPGPTHRRARTGPTVMTRLTFFGRFGRFGLRAFRAFMAAEWD